MPGLVTSYDLQPGNGAWPILQLPGANTGLKALYKCCIIIIRTTVTIITGYTIKDGSRINGRSRQLYK